MIVGLAEYGWNERTHWQTRLHHWNPGGRSDPRRCYWWTHWQPDSGQFYLQDHNHLKISQVFCLEFVFSIVCFYYSPHNLLYSQVEKRAFVVADLGAMMQQHVCWQSIVPKLQPYFPVKCNSSPAVIEVLASLGLGFVCTSKVNLSSTDSGLILLWHHLLFWDHYITSTHFITRQLMISYCFILHNISGTFCDCFNGAFRLCCTDFSNVHPPLPPDWDEPGAGAWCATRKHHFFKCVQAACTHQIRCQEQHPASCVWEWSRVVKDIAPTS